MELISVDDRMTSIRFDIFPTDCQAQLLEEWTEKYSALINTALSGTNAEELNCSEMLPHFASWKMEKRIKRDIWLIQNKRMRKFSKQVFRCDTGTYQLVSGKITLLLRNKRICVPTDGTRIPKNRQGSLTVWKEAGQWKADILLWVKKKKESQKKIMIPTTKREEPHSD